MIQELLDLIQVAYDELLIIDGDPAVIAELKEMLDKYKED